MRTIEIPKWVVGYRVDPSVDYASRSSMMREPVSIAPGTYEIEDVDGDGFTVDFWIIVSNMEVMLPAAQLGLVPCPACRNGRYHYDDGDVISWDYCEECNALGAVTPEKGRELTLFWFWR